jgi:hypothetical protein
MLDVGNGVAVYIVKWHRRGNRDGLLCSVVSWSVRQQWQGVLIE